MEGIGQINTYERRGVRGSSARGECTHTINLANGTTPFIHVFGGEEFVSVCYRLRSPSLVTVKYAHVRPNREQFDLLTEELQEHVLSGGLLIEDIAVAQSLRPDPVEQAWSAEQFKEWATGYYGRPGGGANL